MFQKKQYIYKSINLGNIKIINNDLKQRLMTLIFITIKRQIQKQIQIYHLIDYFHKKEFKIHQTNNNNKQNFLIQIQTMKSLKSSIGLVMTLLLFIVLLQRINNSLTFQQLAVTADSYIINTVTRYTIMYDRTQQNYGVTINVNNYPIASGSNMTVTLPSVYTLNNTTLGVSVMVNNGMVQYPNFTITSNTINVFGLFSTQTIVYNVSLILTNILNPSPAITTGAFSGTIGGDYAQPINLQSVVVLQPAQFESCYMTFNPAYVNRTSSMIITIKTKTFTPYNGMLQIVFPSNTWSQGTATSTTNYLPITSSMSCSNISTNIKPTIICNGTQNQNKITISNMLTNDLSAESMISFQINNFLSPPTNKAADLIVITSMDSAGNQINICSQYISDLIPNVMSSSTITITNGGQPLTVNQQYTIRFMFQTVDVFAVSDYFQILFPQGSNFTFNSNLLTGGINLIKTTATYSNNLLRCYMNTALSVKIYANPFTMYIAAGTYTAPTSIETTGNFQISLMRNGYPMQVGYQSLTAVASTVSGELVTMGTNVVNKITTYTLNVTINDALSSNGKIRVKFPTQLSLSTITSSSCAQLAGTSLSSTPSCTINTTTNTIQLTNINSSISTIPSQTLTIIFTNITNPFSTSPTSTFQIRTFYSSNDSSLVAIGTVNGFTPKEAIIDASYVVISASSYIVLDQSVTYQVKYVVDNFVDQGGWFIMFVPKPIILNTAALTSNCKRGINTATTTTTPCALVSQDGTGYTINFTSPLSSTSLTKGQFITLQLTTLITNPPSTSPVSSFKLYTYSSQGYLIATIQSSLSIQMTSPSTLTAVTYTRDNNANYALTNYQFTIMQHAQMDIGSVVSIHFPTEILPNVSSTCGMTLPYVNASLVCNLVNQSVIVVTLPVAMAISGDTALKLTVSNVRNPMSFRPPGNFLIKTFTANQTYQYAQGSTSNIIANNIASSFALITGTYNPGILDSDITLTISFTPAYQAPAYLQLSIPSYFTVSSSLSCSQVANFNGTCQTISTFTIKISGQFTSTGLTTFQISGFRSTIRPPISTQYIILSSFTIDNYQLDYSSNSIVFTLTCNMPCMTCDSNNKSLCLGCYSNSLITDRINYDNNTGTCYSQCPDGKYQDNVTLLCQNCDPNCATCQGTAMFCTTCNQSTTNIYLNVISTTAQQCVSQCQTMMYPDNTHTPPTCVACQSPCKTCTSLTYCLSCLDTYYFWQNTCTRTCPINITVADNTTGNCILCNTNCLTCTITADTCTSCNSTLILYNNKCLTACISPLVYRPEINTCGPCDTQCKTCTNTASNCTTCDPLSLYAYYFNSTCLQSCPDLYYESISLCSLCSSLNMNCDYCINQTYCEKCNLGFVFFNGQCLINTPIGYVNISGFAQPCSGDCATCVNVQSNCTSCKTMNLFGNVCQSTCPAGYISLSNQCTVCQSPCQTCSQNVNNCTSCITTLTPKVYYLQNSCNTSCPDFYYPDNGTSKCQPCQSPCMKCIDLITCTSCVDNYFLYQQNICLTACPSQFVGINKICQSCLSPCKTCTNSTTTCLTCQSGYFYLASTNQCLLNCGNGLYKEYINQTCISCTPPCSTCTNTTNTCLSCLTGILYNNKCLTQCPVNMYNDTNTCQSCPSVCSSCSSSSICLSCTSPNILYNKYCVSKCPDTYAVIINNTCTKCSTTNCHKCYDNDVCYNCVSDYSLLNGACLSICPSGYQTNGTNCIEVLSSSLQSSGNIFPVPMSITTVVILIACIMSKLQNHRTFLSGATYSLVGIVQTLALIYYIYLYYVNDFYPSYPIGMYIALASLALLYALNLFSIIQSILLCQDKRFCTWRDNSILNKLYNMFSTFISLSISHKFKNLMFSRLFAFHIFSAPLDDVKKFKILNIYSFLSLVHSGGCIFSVITIIKLVDVKTQFFYACLDVLIVVGLNVVLAFFNAFKSSDFFDQTTPQGYLLGKKMYADEDSFNAKLSIAGNDMQNEQGHGCYSKINHTLASNQAFKFKQSDQSRQDINSQQYSDSLTHIVEKQYEDISVQAYDILEQKQSTLNRANFSTLKIQHNSHLPEQSKYTTIFSNFNQDKAVQYTIENDDSNVKKSTRGYEQGIRVADYSVQKYSDKGYVDRSMQGTIQQGRFVDQSVQGTIEQNRLVNQSIQGTLEERCGRNDFSVQFDNDENRLQKDISIQGSIDFIKRKMDASVQGTIDNYVDQSGQYSRLHTQKGVQRTLQVNDHSVQQTINQKQWNGQNTIQMKSISIQKQDEENDNISSHSSEVTFEQQNGTAQNQNETLEQQNDTFEQQNENDETLLKKGSDNIFYIDQDMQDEIDDVGDGCLAQKRIQENKKTIILKQQQVPQQKQDDFDLPADEIVQYQQELEQKIVEKQKQLEKVRREIQIKQKERMLKEKLMKEQTEKMEKQKQNQNNQSKKEEIEREREILMQMQSQKRIQKEIQNQKENEREKQSAQQTLMQKQQQKQRTQREEEQQIKLLTIEKISNIAQQSVYLSHHQHSQPNINTIIHQQDQTTSIDHSQVSPPVIPQIIIDQSPIPPVRIPPHQMVNIPEMKQEKLQKQQQIDYLDDDKTQTQQQELFLNGQITVKNNRKNFQADINVQIKDNDEGNNEDNKWREKDNSQEEQLRSVRTKAKNTQHNSKRQQFINAQQLIQNKRQVQIQPTSRQQQSMILGIQQSQPLENITQPATTPQQILSVQLRKQPGQIRTIIDQLKTTNKQQLQQQQEIDIIQMEDDDNDNIVNNIEQVNQRRGNFIYEQQNGELKQQDQIDFRAYVGEGSNSNDKHKTNTINTIANKSLPLSDHQLPQQHLSHYHYDTLHEQQFDSSQDIPFNYKQIQNRKLKKNTQSDIEDYYHHQNSLRREQGQQQEQQQQPQQHVMSNKNIILNQQREIQLTRKQSQLMRSLNNQSSSIMQLQNAGSRKRFIPQQPETHTQAIRVNIDKLKGYQYNNTMNQHQQQQNSRSLLANNAQQNILVGVDKRESAENQTLKRKVSSKNNPLYTKMKWEHHQEQRLNSIPQSSQPNDSQVMEKRNNQKQPQSRSQYRLPPHPPTQTDKQQTSFTHLGQKVVVQNNKNKSKSFNNVEMKRGQSMKNVQSFEQQQDIKVHFEKQEESTNQINTQRSNGNQQQQRRNNERHNRIPNTRPATTLINNKYPQITRQFQSQQIFGINPNPVSDAQQNSQDQTEFNPSVSKRHKNNLIIDKMMERPDNDDLYEYYNRASTHKGKSKKKRSIEKKQNNASRSREKNQNERNLEKIYLQKLNVSSSSQIPRSKSRGRY